MRISESADAQVQYIKWPSTVGPPSMGSTSMGSGKCGSIFDLALVEPTDAELNI